MTKKSNLTEDDIAIIQKGTAMGLTEEEVSQLLDTPERPMSWRTFRTRKQDDPRVNEALMVTAEDLNERLQRRFYKLAFNPSKEEQRASMTSAIYLSKASPILRARNMAWLEADKAQSMNTPQIMSPDDRKLLERVAEAYEQANRKAISS